MLGVVGLLLGSEYREVNRASATLVAGKESQRNGLSVTLASAKPGGQPKPHHCQLLVRHHEAPETWIVSDLVMF